MKPNKPKQGFTQTAFNVQSDISLIGGRLVRNSVPESGGNGGNGGGIEDPPTDNKVYGRKNNAWFELKKYTVQVCVDGVQKSLNIYVEGEPYTP
jgi:hypothetical protein